MVHSPIAEEPECYECGGSPSFLVIPIGLARRDINDKRLPKNFLSCGRDLVKGLRRMDGASATVRVLD